MTLVLMDACICLIYCPSSAHVLISFCVCLRVYNNIAPLTPIHLINIMHFDEMLILNRAKNYDATECNGNVELNHLAGWKTGLFFAMSPYKI